MGRVLRFQWRGIGTIDHAFELRMTLSVFVIENQNLNAVGPNFIPRYLVDVSRLVGHKIQELDPIGEQAEIIH